MRALPIRPPWPALAGVLLLVDPSSRRLTWFAASYEDGGGRPYQSTIGARSGVDDSGVRERPSPELPAGRPAFDLLPSKLLHPPVRPSTIRRSSLIERLSSGDPRPIVSVVAPAGYGKTTLLAQWAERSSQAFAWVSVDEGDNDPKVLLSYVAEALDAVQPVGGRVFDALASPGQLGAWLGHPPARLGILVDDLAGGAGPGSCTCWKPGSAGMRCRCWPITCRLVRGWCWPGALSRHCGSPGCGPRAGSQKSAPATCR
jgi:hypothetical protein